MPVDFMFGHRKQWEQPDLIYRMKQVTKYLAEYLQSFEYYEGELIETDN